MYTPTFEVSTTSIFSGSICGTPSIPSPLIVSITLPALSYLVIETVANNFSLNFSCEVFL